VRDVLTKSGVPAEQIRFIANGIDTEKFSQGRPILKALPQLQGKRVVGFVGRLVREKGLAYLMQAAQSVLVDDSRIAFVLAGDGPFRKELFSIAKELKIENDVFLLGPRSDLADVYASMDVFVLPSLIEGMPMVVLEAMAAGKPILATRVGGIPQLLQDGKCGILVNAEDASELALALKQLLASPTLCEELGRQGQKRVGTEFSATVMARSYLEMYRNCLRPEHASN
jgi:glycosyltransferase involved in cell wall biosynthesis